MTDSIDISEPLRELCKRLDVVYENVSEIAFRPSEVSVTTWVRTDTGGIAIGPYGQPVSQSVTKRVST